VVVQRRELRRRQLTFGEGEQQILGGAGGAHRSARGRAARSPGSELGAYPTWEPRFGTYFVLARLPGSEKFLCDLGAELAS
jgi:hypothetical protein